MHDGRLLMVRKSDAVYWAIPGGHVEKGETPGQAVTRELEEELQVQVIEDSVRILGTFIDRAADTGEEFSLTLCAGEIAGTPTPSAEIAEYIWYSGTLPDGELPPMFVNHVQPALKTALGWTPRG
jgi:8-oxo-dGTP pyrophosphatase MutT (NUDIX family)